MRLWGCARARTSPPRSLVELGSAGTAKALLQLMERATPDGLLRFPARTFASVCRSVLLGGICSRWGMATIFSTSRKNR